MSRKILDVHEFWGYMLGTGHDKGVHFDIIGALYDQTENQYR